MSAILHCIIRSIEDDRIKNIINKWRINTNNCKLIKQIRTLKNTNNEFQLIIDSFFEKEYDTYYICMDCLNNKKSCLISRHNETYYVYESVDVDNDIYLCEDCCKIRINDNSIRCCFNCTTIYNNNYIMERFSNCPECDCEFIL